MTKKPPPLVLVPLDENELESVKKFNPIRSRFDMRFPHRDHRSSIAAFFLQRYIARHGNARASAMVRELLYRAATGQLGAAAVVYGEDEEVLALDAGLEGLQNFWGDE